MNYTINEAKKIRVGDKLTLDDGTVYEAVEDDGYCGCKKCSLITICSNPYYIVNVDCDKCDFHFKQVKP